MSRIFWTQFNRAIAADNTPAAGALAYFYENESTTAIPVYADDGFSTELSQPIEADGDGLFELVYIDSASPIRVMMTDADSVPLPGYPLDDVIPLAADQSSASSISFAPTEDIPETNVQDAIVAAGALSTDQTAIQQRSLTAWVTGGSSDDYTITPSPVLTALGTWQFFVVRPDRANTTTTVTLNVNSLGAQPWKKYTGGSSTPAALAVGDLQPYRDVAVTWDGTRFISSLDHAQNVAGALFSKSEDGTLMCWASNITVTQSSSTFLSGTFTFGQTFITNPFVSVTLPGTSFGTYTDVAVADVGPARVASGTTSVSIGFQKQFGSTNFPATASITNVRALAIGRWY